DFQSIQKGADTLQDLLNLCYSPEEQDKLLESYHLKEVRHDMRAAVGVMMGYGELVQDVLEELEASKNTVSAVIDLQKKASDLLTVIELFALEDETVEIEESEEDIDVYMPSLVTGNILVVDDSPQKRELLSRKLKKIGHTVNVVEDGMKALEYLRDATPDIILLDLFMPEMNGDKVLQLIKQNERLKEIPVLVISSSSDMDNVVKCIRLGADDYLPMPVNNTLLHARINSCLVKKVARDREQKTLSELNKSRQRLSTAIENIDEGFAIFDTEDVLLTYNNCFKELYPGLKSLGGLSVTYEELIRENIRLGVYQVERREVSPEDGVCLNAKEIEDWVSVKVGRHQNPTQPHVDLLSTGMWVEVIENKIPEGGTVSIHKDVSEGKKKEKHLEYLALHDGLTGLANRKKFDETLNSFFEKAQENNTTFGVAFFDLDGFKAVNDTLGHDFGDFLLKTVSQKLVESVRESDLVARFGGDEFAALVTNISSEEDMVRVAERCLEAIGTHVEKDGQVADFGVSIGLALHPSAGKTPEELLKKADAAMYEAKKAGKGTYRIAS
ncbi:MAG TPA: hypothetical protein DD412_07610, partial [Holosporales bacterium]|nr:hypothetical protein [Holosporales bacterium]